MPTLVRPSQIANVPLGFNLSSMFKADPTISSVVNTLAETTVGSYTLAGGILSTANALWLGEWFAYSNTSGGSATLTWRFKYGGTTVITLQVTIPNTTASAGMLWAILKAAGATNSQAGVATVTPGAITTAGTTGSAAVDSTVSQTVVLTVQWSVANANLSYSSNYRQLQLLPNT